MSPEYTPSQQQSHPSVDNAIRIFVSSTFFEPGLKPVREREELQKIVFPQLGQLCEARGVALQSIDLGWGVLPTRSDPNEALAMCLQNISRCSYFVGILGDQYGSEFHAPDQSLLLQYPWLAERVGRSFVELECVYGALADNPVARRAFFYIRAARAGRACDNEFDTPGHQVGIADSKLAALKQDIRRSSAVVRDYNDIGTFSRFVYGDLAAAIAEDFST